MGGAAAVMASPELEVDAMALEMVYPDINSATANRMERYLGGWARGLGAVIDYAITLARGGEAVALRPIDHVGGHQSSQTFHRRR